MALMHSRNFCCAERSFWKEAVSCSSSSSSCFFTEEREGIGRVERSRVWEEGAEMVGDLDILVLIGCID